MLRNPKLVAVAVFAVIVVSIAGGAIGNEFGGGFLGSPIAHIQLAAESVLDRPLIADIPVVGDFNLTNTMISAWAAILVLASLSYLATRRMQEVPGRLQGAVEVILEGFLDIAESVAGPENARRFFPLVMTIFLFIVTANWMGILPGFGTIGRVETPEEVIEHAEHGAEDGHADLSAIKLHVFEGDGIVAVMPLGSVDHVITAEEYEKKGVEQGKQAGILVPFFRGANTDINMTLAIALVAMFMVHFWGLRILGVFSHVGKFLNFREGPIGLFVGVLEAISEVARLISFTFRLFGNIFAGEVLLIAMAFLVPLVGLIPFLGLELFVGLIQAFIFAMLTLVFAATATVSHDAEGH